MIPFLSYVVETRFLFLVTVIVDLNLHDQKSNRVLPFLVGRILSLKLIT